MFTYYDWKMENFFRSEWNLRSALTDLSRPFDYLPHDLLITKLHASGCDFPSLKLLDCYLRNRRQRVKINIL